MKIVVLCGGLTSERDVSLTTGMMVAKALRAPDRQCAVVDLFLGIEQPITDMDAFFASGGSVYNATIGDTAPDLQQLRAQRTDKSDSRIGPQVIKICQSADIVFMALHGADGEDGRVQALFDLLGIKYTGSGSVASALAMDKSLAKMVFAAHGIKTPSGFTISTDEELPHIQLPCIVKPCSGGSSVATTLVEEKNQLDPALQDVWQYDKYAVVEPYIKGREIQVAVLGDRALPPIELDYDSCIFDYVVKYQSGACREICPAPISDELCLRLQEQALKAHRALGLEVYSRADFIVKDDEIYLLEVNTLPGMTATSLVPQEAAAAGIDYLSLCEMIIDLSLQRFEQ